MTILIKNGRIVDPSQGLDKPGDVLIEKGKVKKIGSKISEKAVTVIDAKGKIVSPGFVDMHAHLGPWLAFPVVEDGSVESLLRQMDLVGFVKM